MRVHDLGHDPLLILFGGGNGTRYSLSTYVDKDLIEYKGSSGFIDSC